MGWSRPRCSRDVLAEASAAEPSERLLQFTVQAAISDHDFWSLRCEMSEKLREKAAKLSSEQLTQAKCQALNPVLESGPQRRYPSCTGGQHGDPAQMPNRGRRAGRDSARVSRPGRCVHWSNDARPTRGTLTRSREHSNRASRAR